MTTSMAVTETQEVVESATLTEKWYTRLTKAQWMVGAGVLIAIVIYAFLHAGRVSTSDAQIEAHIVTIAPHVPGYVEELRIDDNSKVDAGQLLFTIDPRDYQVHLDQAKNAYDATLAQAHAAQVGVDVARNIAAASSRSATASLRAQGAGFDKDREAWRMAAGPELEAAQAVAQAKEAVAERAERDLDRYLPLVKTGEISQLQFDAFSASAKVAQSEAAQARAQIDTARRIVTIAHSQMDISDAGIDRAKASLTDAHARALEATMRVADWNAAQAAVEQAKARVYEAKLNLSYTAVTSPVAGVVTHRLVEVGQYIQPGQAMLEIIPLHDVWVVANFKETQLAHVHPGQRASIHIDAFDTDVDGWVDSLAGSTGARQALLPPENATGNFVKVVERVPVKLRLRESALTGKLRPGMNVEVTIYTR